MVCNTCRALVLGFFRKTRMIPNYLKLSTILETLHEPNSRVSRGPTMARLLSRFHKGVVKGSIYFWVFRHSPRSL